jgi:flagellar capping protein FliD
VPIVSRTSELEAENARLRREIESLHRENESLRKERDDHFALADRWRFYQVQAQQYAMNEQAQWQQAQWQQAQAQQAQARQWYHCDCTPPHGRAGYLLGDNQ